MSGSVNNNPREIQVNLGGNANYTYNFDKGTVNIAGVGLYHLKLFKGTGTSRKEITDEIKTKNPRVMQKMANLVMQILYDKFGDDLKGLGEKIVVSKDNDSVSVKYGTEDTKSFKDETHLEGYKRITEKVISILQGTGTSRRSTVDSNHGDSKVQSDKKSKTAPKEKSQEQGQGKAEAESEPEAESSIQITERSGDHTDSKHADTVKKAKTAKGSAAPYDPAEDAEAINDDTTIELQRKDTAAHIEKTHSEAMQLQMKEIEDRLASHFEENPRLVISVAQKLLHSRRVNSPADGRKYGEITMAEVLAEPGNEALQAVVKKYASMPCPETPFKEKIPGFKPSKKEIRFIFLEYLKRNPCYLRYDLESFGKEKDSIQQCQTFAQGLSSAKMEELFKSDGRQPISISSEDIQGMFKENRAWTSAFDKIKHPNASDKEKAKLPELNGHAPNLGAVTTTLPDGTEQVSCLRSGKTYDINRIKENVIFGCLLSWMKSGSNGLGITLDASGDYVYQQMITSYLDMSWLKSNFPTAESERGMLESLLREVDKWPEQGIKINVPHKDGGTTTITLLKPMIAQQVLSGTIRAPFDTGEEFSPKINWETNQRLLAGYMQASKDPMGTADLQAIYRKTLGAKQGNRVSINFTTGTVSCLKEKNSKELHTASYDRLQKIKFFDSDEYVKYNEEVAKYILKRIEGETPGKVRDDFIALYTLFTEKNPPLHKEIDKQRVHLSTMIIYRRRIASTLKIMESFQCKSGVDRTGLAIAIAMAMDNYKLINGKDYSPYNPDIVASKLFAKLFNDALKAFGMKVTVWSKGEWGIRWAVDGKVLKQNPVPYIFLKDIDPKLLTRTYNANDPYENQLANPYILLGASDPKILPLPKMSETEKNLVKPIKAIIKTFVNVELNDSLNPLEPVREQEKVHKFLDNLKADRKEFKEGKNYIRNLSRLTDDLGTREQISQAEIDQWNKDFGQKVRKGLQEAYKTLHEETNNPNQHHKDLDARTAKLNALNEMINLFGQPSDKIKWNKRNPLKALASPGQIHDFYKMLHKLYANVREIKKLIGEDAYNALVIVNDKIKAELLEYKYLIQAVEILKDLADNRDEIERNAASLD